jgi:hypothetical protein
MQALYLAVTGRRPCWADLAAIGPFTLQQVWVITAARLGRAGAAPVPVRVLSVAFDAPRRLVSRAGLLRRAGPVR